ATVRVTTLRDRAIELPEPDAAAPSSAADPATLPPRRIAAPHGGPWFMDSMAVHAGADGTAWFRCDVPVGAGAGPLAVALGPADWAHGIARPIHGVVADPNPDLSVRLLRPSRDGWIGVRAAARWQPQRGTGTGHGVLLDRQGEIGSVAMSVA